MKRSSLIFLIFSAFISSIGILALLQPGFFLSDDGQWMVIRFSAFYENLVNGQLPVRFLSRLNNGFGYPVSNFLYPLFMYIGAPIKVLGFSFVDTIKIILAGSFVASAIFSFLWLRKLFDNTASFIGALVYSLFPYHLWDIYKRGSVGEVLALGIVPFILWQIERRSLIWGAIGTALLVTSHNTLAILFLIFILLYAGLDIFITKNKRALLHYYTSILAIGLGLSSFFWIPAIFDLQYTVFSSTSISDWSKYFSDLSLIGLSTLAIFLITFVFMLTRKIDVRRHRLTVVVFLIGTISILFASSISSPMWNFLPATFIQFPFRFLSLTIISTSFLAACLVSVLKRTSKTVVASLILILVFLSSRDFLTPKVFQNYPDTFYSTNQDTTTVKNEYMPKWIKNIPNSYSNKVEVLKGNSTELEDLSISPNKISFKTSSNVDSVVQVNTAYFPGWKSSVNGKDIKINYEENGRIRINIPKGENKVEVKFAETNIRLISDLISIMSILLVVGWLKFK